MEWPGPDDGLEIFMRLWVEDVVRFFLVLVGVSLVAFVVISLFGAWGTDVGRRRLWEPALPVFGHQQGGA